MPLAATSGQAPAASAPGSTLARRRTQPDGSGPAAVQMYELLYSSLASQLVIVAAELGVADHLGDELLVVEELARRTETDAEALYRMLRALASIGVFTEVSHRTFGLTPLAETLRSDASTSMRDLARYVGLPERQRAFAALIQSVRTGEPAFDHVHGRDWWTHFAAHPELAELFNRAMGSMARLVNSATLAAHDLGDVRHLVDVGGGQGQLVTTILRRYPEMTAVVFDLPHVAARAEEVMREAGLAGRVECVGGDFLQAVPAGGDAYVLSWTLHDWDDKDSVRILRNVRAAMAPGARLIVIDEVIPVGDEPHFGKFEDIVMLALLKGRVRTAAQFAALFEAAGMRIAEIIDTPSPTSVIVVTADTA